MSKTAAVIKDKRYLTQEFARLAGVTVRTLHHYDRLGLVKPAGRSSAGYRLYDGRSLERLEQVIALKFIGLSLEEIKRLLSRKTKFSLRAALRMQRWMIEAKREHLERVARVIDQAEPAPEWESLKQIIEAIGKEQPMEWTKKYYSEEARKELEARHNPEAASKGTEAWAELIHDVEEALASGKKSDSAEGRALAARWAKLIAAFTGGNPAIASGLDQMYSDPGFKKPYSDEVGEFIAKARRA